MRNEQAEDPATMKPFFGKTFLVAGCKYKDGRVSTTLKTEAEWAALSETERDELSRFEEVQV